MLTAEQKKQLEESIREFVGRPIGPDFVGRDTVNEPMIRQWCDAMGETNPVYLDPDAAKASAHGGIVAPPMMMQAWTMQGWEMHEGYDEPKNEEQRLHKILTDAGYSGVLGTDTEQSFARYLRPGDEIVTKTVIEEISEEKATGVGIGYFITTRSTYTDSSGEEVGWMTFRVLKFIPSEPQQAVTSEEAAPQAPSRIKPPMGHDNAWWWNAIAAGRFVIQRCAECGTTRHPPRPMCAECQSLEWNELEVSGRGVVHSYTVVHYPQFPGYDFPILAVLVDLEEGERIVSNLVGCEPDEVEIGQAVQAFIHEDEDGFKLPLFRLAEGAD